MKKSEMVSELEEIKPREERFLFVGEALALDLVNTEMIVRGKRRDTLGMGEDVRAWWREVRARYPEVEDVWRERREHGGDGSGESGEHKAYEEFDAVLLDALKALRGALRQIFGALVEGSAPLEFDVQVLNSALRTGYHALEVVEGGDLRGIYRTYDEAKGKLLFPIALSALHLIQNSERKRLHKCDNERCILYFYDTTRSATRRWCSLDCMDRARSARRYRLAVSYKRIVKGTR